MLGKLRDTFRQQNRYHTRGMTIGSKEEIDRNNRQEYPKEDPGEVIGLIFSSIRLDSRHLSISYSNNDWKIGHSKT